MADKTAQQLKDRMDSARRILEQALPNWGSLTCEEAAAKNKDFLEAAAAYEQYVLSTPPVPSRRMTAEVEDEDRQWGQYNRYNNR